jgi:porin
VAETGVTPDIGSSKLPGKYAFGGIYFGVENRSFGGGETNDGRYSLYWQADQMLFREPSAGPAPAGKGPSDGKSMASGKSFKDPVSAKPPKLSEQGLYFFSFFTFAPQFNNAMPFYFHTGLVYKGLIPTRDADQIGISLAYGSYSGDKFDADQARGNPTQVNEAFLEVDYRFQVTKFAYAQPFLQYSIRPGGTGLVENAAILGVQMGVTF